MTSVVRPPKLAVCPHSERKCPGQHTRGILGIVVRPPGLATLTQNPKTPFDEGVRTYERGAGVALPVANSPRIQRVAGE